MHSTSMTPRPPTGDGLPRPPYGAALGFTSVVLALYVLTIAPTTQFWDTSEYIAAAKVLGIPHPPGNPLFVLLARVWGLVPWAAAYALRINLLAAATTALAAGLLFLCTERMLSATTNLPRWLRILVAAGGGVAGAASFTVWNQATVNEKTYTISLLSIALVMWLTVRWADSVPGVRDRYLVLIAYTLALTTGNHLMGLLGAPLVAVYVLWTEPQALVRWRLWTAIAVATTVALTVWVYLPIRAAHLPPINEGEPTTWEALKAVLARDQYQKPPMTVRQADLLSQLGMYLQYFQWQYAKDWAGAAQRILAAGFGLLALVGATRQWRRDRRGAAAMTALMLTVTAVLVYYLNFKYGYSYRPDENLTREVRERDYFFVASFLLWGVWIGIGLGVVVEATARWLQPAVPDARRWRLAAPLAALCVIPVLGNRISASRAGETFPRTIALDLLQSVEPYAILITAGDNDTFPLWYAQEVEGVRRDVIIANQSLMQTDWHLRQINRRPVFPFDTARAAAPYRGRHWTPPSNPPFALSDRQLDALPEVYPVTRRSAFRVDSLVITLESVDLLRSDLATLQLIRDNLGKRPIYFSRTTGSYADDMGFTPYLLSQGLARKLLAAPIRAAPGIVFDRRLGWVDVDRSTQLLFDTFHWRSAIRSRPLGWVDRPSESMLVVYGLSYLVAADLARQLPAPTHEDSLRASQADSIARQAFASTSLQLR